jgi:uncharacterized protein (TIGR02453 family)
MYFNQGYVDFFQQLHQNNSKRWFGENRKWYELAVREPFKELIDDLLPEIKKLDEGNQMDAKDAMFRINRDLRFSQDKPPYNTHMAAGFSKGGRKSQYAGFFLQIGLKHIFIGGGLPFIEKEVLRKIRIEIGYNNKVFQRIIEDPEFKSLFGFVHGEHVKELPKSFIDIHEESPIIANKQFYYGAFYKTENWLFKSDFPAHILRHYKAGVIFNNFLIKAISDFTLPSFPSTKRQVLEF